MRRVFAPGRRPHLCRVLAVLMAFGQILPAASAAEFRVFRRTYIRDADAPDTVTQSFTVLNPATTWRLRAINGSLEDTTVEKVSSSTLQLNGLGILQPNQFSQNVNAIEVPVSLLSSNTVSTQLRSKPGGQLTVEILGQDNAPPTATWHQPSDGSLTNAATVAATLALVDDVAGLDPASLSIRLDGTSVLGQFPAVSQPTLQATLAGNLTVAEGVHALTAQVRDLAGQLASADVSFTVDRTPPAITDLTPADGATVASARPEISASYADALSGVDVSSVHLTFDGTDVTVQAAVTETSVSFTPASGLADGSHTAHVQVADRAGNLATAQTTFTIQTIVTPPVTPQSGFIHGAVFHAVTEQPLADARITARGIGGEVRSGPDGGYQFPTPGTGEFLLNIEQEGFTSVQRKIEVLATHDVAVEPAFLTPLDPQVTLIAPEAGGLATDSSGDFQVEFPPGAAPRDLQVRITPLHDERQLPGPFPREWAHIGAVFFEPRFTAFEKPATFRNRNRQGFAPGTSVVLTLWDEDTQRWLDAGSGHVSADGQWIEFPIVRFFCWYCFRLPRTLPAQAENPDLEDTKTKAEVQDPKRKCEVEGGSTVCPEGGDLAIAHALPALRTLGQSRSLTFTYHSTTADPSVLIGTDYLLETVSKPGDAGTLVPIATSTTIQVEGQRVQASFTGTAGSTRQAFLWGGRNARGERVPAGAYPYTIELSNDYPSTFGTTGIPTGDRAALTTAISGHAILINQRDSSFGAGWNLNGLQRLFPQPDGTVLVADGDGSAMVFRPGPMADLVVANFFSNDVSVLFGHGDGTFQPQQTITMVSPAVSSPLPLWPAVADFNQDGFQDLVIALSRNEEIAILFGLGGTFTPPQHLAVGRGPVFVAAADFNRDGMQDLIVVNQGSNDVSVLFGNGDGTFQPQQRLGVGQRPASVAVGDLNGDGFADFVTTNQGGFPPFGIESSEVSVVLGNGDGTFQAERRLSVGRGPTSILAEDINSDDLPDLAVANAFNNDISILLGNGDGTFQPQRRFPGAISSFNGIAALAVGDFNGDAKRDLIETGLDTANIAVLFGNGDGTFQPLLRIPAGGPPFSVAVVDLNRDGAQDLALTNGAFDSSVMLGNGDGTFQRPLRFAVGASPAGIAVGEFNDRIDEEASTFTGLPGDFSQLKRNPDGTFVRILTDGIQLHFDTQGFHEKTVDRNGNETRYTYDVQDRLSRIEFPGGATFDFAYNPANGHLASVTDSSGRTTQFLINGDANLRKITNPEGTIRQFTYDAEHRLRSQTNERGFTTDYAYDAFGRLAEAILPERPTFDPTTGTMSPQQEVRRFIPSETQGLINALPVGVGTPENPAPPAFTPLASFRDGQGHLTQLATDRYGAPTKLTDPLGRITLIERDVNGLPTAITRPNGNAVTMTYDGAGNLLRLRQQRDVFTAPEVTQFEYEPIFNQVTKIVDGRRDSIFDPVHPCENGCTTTLAYDSQGNLSAVTDGVGNVTTFEYDSRGLLLTITDALGTLTPVVPDDHQTHFTYDPVTGNLLSTTDPVGRTSALQYNAAGHVTLSSDPALRQTLFGYDVMNRLTSVADAAAGATTYAYDAAGNLTRVTDASSQATVFAHDALNQLVGVANPLGQTKQFFYDLNRNVARVLDAKSQTIDFRYDAANQLVEKVLKNAVGAVQDLVVYGFDVLGNLALVRDADSRLTFEYDSLGRLVKTESGDASDPSLPHVRSSLTYTYDGAGNRRSAGLSALTLSTPTGVGVSYGYDRANRLTSVFSQNVFARSLFYDALGRLTRLGSGPDVQFRYDDASQLTRIEHRISTSLADPPLATFDYTYDLVGNRDTLTDRLGLHIYGYDALSRLTSADHPLASGLVDELFNYDPVGNRLTSHLSAAYAHNPANQLLEDDQFTYTYDANGNLTSKTDKLTLAVTTYTYDVENQLIQIDLPGGGLATYRYDALGRRTEKAVGGAITRYAYEGEDIWSQVDAVRNCATHMYFHGPGIDQPVGFLMDQEGDCNFTTFAGFSEPALTLQTDGLGSVTTLINQTRDFFRSTFLAERVTYDSFGTPTITGPGPDQQMDTADDVVLSESAFGNPFLFTGREYDPESRLYYYRARYYDPRMGRFLQEDPVGGSLSFPEQHSNYTYVANRPTVFVDPYGQLIFGRKEAEEAILENFDKVDPNGVFNKEERTLIARKFVDEINEVEATKFKSAIKSGDAKRAKEITDNVYKKIKKKVARKGTPEEQSLIEKIERVQSEGICILPGGNDGTTPGP